MAEAGKQVSGRQQKRDWLLHACLTALAAGTLVAFGHWFSSSKGRRIGGDKRRLSRPSDNASDDETKTDSETNGKGTQMSLAELRLRRLKAVEARLHSQRNEPSAAGLTPLGRILKLSERVEKLEEETHSFLQNLSANTAVNSMGEKEHARLLELLTSLQIEIDRVPGDESVRPHRKSQTSRIQSLLAHLNELKHHKISSRTVVAEVGSSLTGSGTI